VTPEDIPVLAAVLESGPDDRVFDGLLLLGPVVVTLIAVLGRSPVTELLAVLYVSTFVCYVAYRGLTAE